GLESGLATLSQIKEHLNVPVLTDVHLPEQCAPAAEVCDVLQIPAFLCRQTDLLQAAGATGKAINIKKGQFLAPEGMAKAADKVRATGNEKVLLTERGTFFGYGRLVVDFAGFAAMRAAAPLIFDATHSVQQPGGLGNCTGGDWQMAPALLRAAAAVGCDGWFIETHPNPQESPSDGPNMIPLEHLRSVLEEALTVHAAVKA
ncbi:MAG: 3-deoxy-8-phosphooctulonate synthase, partial [Planctomycetes bacterium]|nr:3-deoxy-8-phosphooctulonate synthase [Planctomycetota bacterium]